MFCLGKLCSYSVNSFTCELASNFGFLQSEIDTVTEVLHTILQAMAAYGTFPESSIIFMHDHMELSHLCMPSLLNIRHEYLQ